MSRFPTIGIYYQYFLMGENGVIVIITTMRNSKTTAFLLLIGIIIILSGLVIVLLHDHCSGQDVVTVPVMDAPITVASDILATKIKATTVPAPSSPTTNIQGFVISSHQSRFQTFLWRNRASLPLNTTNTVNNTAFSLTWFAAANGRDQVVLNQHATLTGLPLIKADSTETGYKSPHHTGCFMSHWQVLRMAKSGWEALQTLPSALLIMEDDAICAPLVVEEITKTLPLLPPDWDIFYVGAKPFSFYFKAPMIQELKKTRGTQANFSQEEWEEWLCQGKFGPVDTGPFAPDGGRNLSLNQPYWRTRYALNTHAYLVNPKRIDRILHMLEHPPRGQEPIDIMFAFAGKDGDLKKYMTTMEYCLQKSMTKDVQIDKPRLWEGYYTVYGLPDSRWSTMYHEKCPSKP